MWMKRLYTYVDKTIIPTPFTWLYDTALSFKVKGDQVTVLQDPQDFYQELLNRCKKSQNRIVLASLYLGTGLKEKNLVSVIKSRLEQANKNFQVSILLDANRGSRGEESSRSILLPLLTCHENCQVSLFHSPNLRGPLKHLLPNRFNELLGLQHMKFYIFDDDVFITGANLSNDYFTNRQDRYILISNCKILADFYSGLVECISQLSFQLDSTNNVHLNKRSKFHPFNDDKGKYAKAGQDLIQKFYTQFIKVKGNIHEDNSECDTVIFPFLELPPFNIHQDSVITRHLLDTAKENTSIHLATGYFNLTDEYVDSITNKSKAVFKILMAHPSANGFLNASGVAKAIPEAYTTLAFKFLCQVEQNNSSQRVKLFEFIKPGWTFHSKGLWYSLPGEIQPHLTLIGSSNFGARSVKKDLEMQVAIVTVNPDLRRLLLQEQQRLFSLGIPFTKDVANLSYRKAPFWVKSASQIFRNYF